MTDFAACAPGRLLDGLHHRAGRTGDRLGHTLQSAFSLLGLTHCHLVKEKPELDDLKIPRRPGRHRMVGRLFARRRRQAIE